VSGPAALPGGFTGGQYSLLRAGFGVVLCVTLLRLLPFAGELFSGELFSGQGLMPLPSAALGFLDDPHAARGVVALGAAAAAALALGLRDRWAALVLWLVWALLQARNPLTGDSGTAFVGWVLLLHAALPRAPFGSLDARGRLDPGGGWCFPAPLRTAAWVLLAVSTSYSGLTKLARPTWRDGQALGDLLHGPLARDGFLRDLLAGLSPGATQLLSFALLGLLIVAGPAALWPRLRPWIWLLLAAASLAVLVTVDSPDAGLGRLALLGLCFQPSWVRGAMPAATELVFYDGQCGLCHRVVRFVLAEDPGPPRFRFAPLGGSTFESVVPAELRAALPPTVLVLTQGGELLDRSRAVLHLGHRLGGLWRVAAWCGEAVPLALRDRLYDLVARIRHRLFPAPEQACPLLPPELRERFEP
jgi:predicted DCC family thiol-disulfide oxidoreductase YuxK